MIDESIIIAADADEVPAFFIVNRLYDFKYVGKQYLDNTANNSRSLDAFFTEDLRAVYSFSKKWLKNADIIFQMNNLFNEMYEPNGYTFSYFYNGQMNSENYYFPMAGRNWMAGINLKF